MQKCNDLKYRINYVKAMIEMIGEDSMDIVEEPDKFEKLTEILDGVMAELSELFFIGKDKNKFDCIMIGAKKIAN